VPEERGDYVFLILLVDVHQQIVWRNVGVGRVGGVLQAEAGYHWTVHSAGEVHCVIVRVEHVALLVSIAQRRLRVKELLAWLVDYPHAVGEVGMPRYARSYGAESLSQPGGNVREAAALRASGGEDGVFVGLFAALYEVNRAHAVKVSVAVVVLVHVSSSVRIEVVAVLVVTAELLSAR